MIGCEWMDGKVVGRMVAGWWEGGGRIVGGMVVALGLLSSCNGDLRDRLMLPHRNQVCFQFEGPVGIPLELLPLNRAMSRVQFGNSVFLSGGD